jgi:glucose/arabinose dehydrogenase
MVRWILSGLGASIAAGALLVTSAGAASGPPPLPTAANGAKVQLFAGGVNTPTSFAIGGGNVFEGDGGSDQSGKPAGGVFLLKGGTATKLAGSPAFVAGLAWHKGTLYVSAANLGAKGAIVASIQAWSGWNGTTFAKQKTIYSAPKKFPGFNGLAFGPDGRLYVGVDVSLDQSNDHGPAKAPYQYDILSMKANGKSLKVFATGMRQPWQMAFNGKSKSPFVTDLGQDKPANVNPPDFILKVRKGDNYGFPACNWIKAKPCKGYTKPYKFLSPHADAMGLAIIGKKLFISEFGGNAPGKVVSMPVGGGKITPAVTGFVAPVVGLAASGHSLYIGELTGQVFKVNQ